TSRRRTRSPSRSRRACTRSRSRTTTASSSSVTAGSSSARPARAMGSSSPPRSESGSPRSPARLSRRSLGILLAMPFYQRLGEVPRKRHIQFRENGTLLVEEVMGLEGFSGLESILYHLVSPCRVMKLDGFEPIVREEWVPDQHAHRHFKTFDVTSEGDACTGRRRPL